MSTHTHAHTQYIHILPVQFAFQLCSTLTKITFIGVLACAIFVFASWIVVFSNSILERRGAAVAAGGNHWFQHPSQPHPFVCHKIYSLCGFSWHFTFRLWPRYVYPHSCFQLFTSHLLDLIWATECWKWDGRNVLRSCDISLWQLYLYCQTPINLNLNFEQKFSIEISSTFDLMPSSVRHVPYKRYYRISSHKRRPPLNAGL